MTEVIVTQEVRREVLETDGSAVVVETPLIGPQGPPGDSSGGAELEAHEADTTSVHGIPDTSVLATDADVAAEETARKAADALLLPKTGGTLTGPLVLPGNAAAPLQATPLQQV